MSPDPAWQPRPAWDGRSLGELGQMSDDELRSALRASPMKRARMDGLRRNIQIARDNAARD